MEPIKTRTADAFKMSLEAGELVIEFGNVVGPGQTPGPTAVAITDRVILPLDTGRRTRGGAAAHGRRSRHSAPLRALVQDLSTSVVGEPVPADRRRRQHPRQ